MEIRTDGTFGHTIEELSNEHEQYKSYVVENFYNKICPFDADVFLQLSDFEYNMSKMYASNVIPLNYIKASMRLPFAEVIVGRQIGIKQNRFMTMKYINDKNIFACMFPELVDMIDPKYTDKIEITKKILVLKRHLFSHLHKWRIKQYALTDYPCEMLKFTMLQTDREHVICGGVIDKCTSNLILEFGYSVDYIGDNDTDENFKNWCHHKLNRSYSSCSSAYVNPVFYVGYAYKGAGYSRKFSPRDRKFPDSYAQRSPYVMNLPDIISEHVQGKWFEAFQKDCEVLMEEINLINVELTKFAIMKGNI